MKTMNKTLRFLAAVLAAMGNMLSLTPRSGRTREVDTVSDEPAGQPQQRIARHFEAAFAYLERAVERDEQGPGKDMRQRP